jgi:hypothetical protein
VPQNKLVVFGGLDDFYCGGHTRCFIDLQKEDKEAGNKDYVAE